MNLLGAFVSALSTYLNWPDNLTAKYGGGRMTHSDGTILVLLPLKVRKKNGRVRARRTSCMSCAPSLVHAAERAALGIDQIGAAFQVQRGAFRSKGEVK
jgi:hypothetical protein